KGGRVELGPPQAASAPRAGSVAGSASGARSGSGSTSESAVDDPFAAVKELLGRYRPVAVRGLPRFCGGLVGYLGYDLVRFFERLPDNNPDTLNLPDLYFMITDTLLIFDHVRNKIQIVSNVHVGSDMDAAYATGVGKIHRLEDQLRGPLEVPQETTQPADGVIRSNFTREGFRDVVRKAKEYICAGDIFQVVLSQRFARNVSVGPVTLYRALRCINPSPYMVLMQFPELALVGSSPEVMTQVQHGRCMVRPIAGTRPRGATSEEDLQLERDLLADEKECAEHVMLVDLGRNDIGRVSQAGSVAPVSNKMMVIERYSHVMHIVSEVAGAMRPECDAFDALAATFPMGTVSGAPKIRAMEIIDELEPERRGAYSGGCGYISFSGEMDTCILIRTMVVKDGTAYLQAGAGIVYDSDPEREYEETVSKARAMVRAIDLAEKGLEL
ncbi:MAG: anthranilate synthase component I, partial [Candidatus Hydrogenedentes bacterium]|nr:anthranilate synthase component I [Candidatus Hydrogenedentota bacterium]